MVVFFRTVEYITEARINWVVIRKEDILSLIRGLNPNKATGMVCNESVVLPLTIIFKTILESSIYPDQWKLPNVVPIYEKEDKQLVRNYRPISLPPICGKIFGKNIFNSLYK